MQAAIGAGIRVNQFRDRAAITILAVRGLRPAVSRSSDFPRLGQETVSNGSVTSGRLAASSYSMRRRIDKGHASRYRH